ncbi:hypothetical protein GCM10029976_050510 [Kribbella albertanoniae]|uniref:Uncharacterized protein n=1 Tax=Kribbella albertanoniae TaxID=1266829 RepID=A0A4R4Q587_9ACTN|nr:hypothetical protein [Kribbella albertanoniae]TDC30129.1 hypothetical protein E1261_14190 [Kribbella albertanoniae]
MRRVAATTAAAAALLTAGLATPAWAAAPDAPTDVKVAFGADEKVQLTWKDNGEANVVYLKYQNDPTLLEVAKVAAADANDVLVPRGIFAHADHVQLVVKAAVAEELSEPGLSPEFDTLVLPAPVLQDANLLPNLSTQLKWTQAAIADGTPNDPLDDPLRDGVEVTALRPNGKTESLGFVQAPATTFTFVPQPRPTTFTLYSSNPWGQAKAVKTVKVGTLGAGITVPATAAYSTRLAIKSTLDLFTSPGREERASAIPVELQARAKTTDAWKTYGRYAGNTTTAFDTGIASLGNRQYRLWVPARKVVSGNVIVLTPASSTSAKSSKTFINYAGSGFSPSTGRIGTRWTFSVKIQPAVTVQGKLQFWDGRAWFDAGPLPITKGSYVERGGPETERVSIRVRVTVPTVVVNGLTVNATTSSAYNLTIR